jgi:uncharacterized protein (TIGR00730 family)
MLVGMTDKPEKPAERPRHPHQAYHNPAFIESRDARALRILAEYIEPSSRFRHYAVEDTIVFMGSARLISRAAAEAALAEARLAGAETAGAERKLELAGYYEAARELAHRLTAWSKGLGEGHRRFVVCTGGGPGIMEAANRGASEARGINVGLSISLPQEEYLNEHVSRELGFNFHYFFMRKFWFAYLAKAVIFFPGGFGTLDELCELLTLMQTRKIRKRLPLVLYGTDYWDRILDFDAMVESGTIDEADLKLLRRCDSVDDAFDYLTRELMEYAIAEPGATL